MVELALPKRIWWPWDEEAGRIGFSRDFTITSNGTGKLYAACSSAYRVWLDGNELAVSPSPLPSWRSMDRIEVSLEPGAHRLCVETDGTAVHQPFFMAVLDLSCSGDFSRSALCEGEETTKCNPYYRVARYYGRESLLRVPTDAHWEMTRAPQPGWTDPSAAHSAGDGWRPAWAFDGVWAEPWGMPCNAPDDFCRLTPGWQRLERQELTQIARLHPGPASLGSALEVAADGRTRFTPPLPHPIAFPKIELARPRLEWYRTREAHSLINNTWLDLFESRCPSVVFDAGLETFARVRVRLESGGPAILAVTTGESLNEVDRYARRVTDLVTLRDGEEFVTSPTGFRYVKVMALSAGSPIGSESGATGQAVLAPVEVQHLRYPIEHPGGFACSDPVLNQIFELSVRTVQLCMLNEIWDGIKRDQLPWMGDLYTELLAVYLLLGDTRLARRSLKVLAEIGPAPTPALADQVYPGLTAVWGGNPYAPADQKNAPNAVPVRDINDIPCYTLWWMLGVWDYWVYTGDRSLVLELRESILATLEHITGWVGADGDAVGVWRLKSGWDFVDWAPLTAEERATYSHLLACRAVERGIDLLELAGDGDTQNFREILAQMRTAAREIWWRDGKGSFGSSHHTNTQAICSGVLRADEAARVFATGLQNDPPLSMTYWHRYLDLEAALQVGQIQWGLDYIRRHWGRMLEIGATTLWEAFDPAWIGEDPHAVSMVGAGYARYGGYETSLCHGWSAGPAAWVMSAVLGVRPVEPGFAAIAFAPNLGDLDWAEGSIPTPRGFIRVRLDKRPGKPSLARLTLPAGVVCTAAEEGWEVVREVDQSMGDW
jgi:hypothetical protein